MRCFHVHVVLSWQWANGIVDLLVSSKQIRCFAMQWLCLVPGDSSSSGNITADGQWNEFECLAFVRKSGNP